MRQQAVVICAVILLSLAGCAKPENDILETQTVKTVMPQGKDFSNPEHGKEVAFAYGALTGTNGHDASGVGFLHVYADGASTVELQLNIATAPKGSQYVGWIEKSGDASSTVRLREFAQPFGDARHGMEQAVHQNLGDFTNVIIRLESINTPDPAAPIVAVGTLKPTKR